MTGKPYDNFHGSGKGGFFYLKLVGVHVQATEGTGSRMDMYQSRCLRWRQYLTQLAVRVSAQEILKEGAGGYHSTNREVLKQCPGTN